MIRDCGLLRRLVEISDLALTNFEPPVLIAVLDGPYSTPAALPIGGANALAGGRGRRCCQPGGFRVVRPA